MLQTNPRILPMENACLQVEKHVMCCLSKVSRSSVDLLVDRRDNGEALGNDVRVVSKYPDRTVDARGIDINEITHMPLVSDGGFAMSTSGEVMFIMHQHAYHGKNKNIHYFPQIEHHNNTVDEMSKKVGGCQHMTILDKCKPQMSIINTLTCAPLRPHEDKEWEELPHVILASGMDWDPTVFDCEGQVYNEEWFDAQSSFPGGPTNESFDEIGNYRFRSNNHQIFFFDTKTYDLDEFMKTFIDCNNITTKSNDLEHELL